MLQKIVSRSAHADRINKRAQIIQICFEFDVHISFNMFLNMFQIRFMTVFKIAITFSFSSNKLFFCDLLRKLVIFFGGKVGDDGNGKIFTALIFLSQKLLHVPK